jgi:hypothetical protein
MELLDLMSQDKQQSEFRKAYRFHSRCRIKQNRNRSLGVKVGWTGDDDSLDVKVGGKEQEYVEVGN